jgi:hypothetical protein
MTYPPQGSDEHGPDGGHPEPPPADPDRFATEPAPTVDPGSPGPTAGFGPPGYGQDPRYGASPQDQPQFYGQQAPPPYGQPYGQQPYGQPYGQQPYGPAQQYGPPVYGPFPYGAPGQPFGAPSPGPPAKSKVGLIAVLTLVALVVIAAAVVMVRTFQSTVLDAASAERDVAAQFQEREGVAIDLTCPDDMAVRKGATYTCTGKTADGEAVTLRLAITNAKTAAYTWTEP